MTNMFAYFSQQRENLIHWKNWLNITCHRIKNLCTHLLWLFIHLVSIIVIKKHGLETQWKHNKTHYREEALGIKIWRIKMWNIGAVIFYQEGMGWGAGEIQCTFLNLSRDPPLSDHIFHWAALTEWFFPMSPCPSKSACWSLY